MKNLLSVIIVTLVLWNVNTIKNTVDNNNLKPSSKEKDNAKDALDKANKDKIDCQNRADKALADKNYLEKKLDDAVKKLADLGKVITIKDGEIKNESEKCHNKRIFELQTLINDLTARKTEADLKLRQERDALIQLEIVLNSIAVELNTNQEYVNNAPAKITGITNEINTFNTKIATLQAYRQNTLDVNKTKLTSVILVNANNKVADDTQSLNNANQKLSECRVDVVNIRATLGQLNSVAVEDQEDFNFKSQYVRTIKTAQVIHPNLVDEHLHCVDVLNTLKTRLFDLQNSVENKENVALQKVKTDIVAQYTAYIEKLTLDFDNLDIRIDPLNLVISTKAQDRDTKCADRDNKINDYNTKLAYTNDSNNADGKSADKLRQLQAALFEKQKAEVICTDSQNSLLVETNSLAAIQTSMANLTTEINTNTSNKAAAQADLDVITGVIAVYTQQVAVAQGKVDVTTLRCNGLLATRDSNQNILTKLPDINITLEKAENDEKLAAEKLKISLDIIKKAVDRVNDNCHIEETAVAAATAKLIVTNTYLAQVNLTIETVDKQISDNTQEITDLTNKIAANNSLITQINFNKDEKVTVTIPNLTIKITNQREVIKTAETTTLVVTINNSNNINKLLKEAQDELAEELAKKHPKNKHYCDVEKIMQQYQLLLSESDATKAQSIIDQQNLNNLTANYVQMLKDLDLAITNYNKANSYYKSLN